MLEEVKYHRKTAINKQGQFLFARCERRFSMMVPDSYTKSGSKPSELFGLGSVELKRKFPTETKTCPKP
uniref:Uncharacterized protein n=1 Tax=Parascaris equorum TaxID=6256 RepID=A0A914R7L3_PAREQ